MNMMLINALYVILVIITVCVIGYIIECKLNNIHTRLEKIEKQLSDILSQTKTGLDNE